MPASPSGSRDGCRPAGAGRLQGRTVIALLAYFGAISVVDAFDHCIRPFVETDLCDLQGIVAATFPDPIIREFV